MNTAAENLNPWKGLHFYTEKDRGIFFGRNRETEEFFRLIQRDTLSVLFARSGLGKTSLLQAGVIPRLREQNFLPVTVREVYADTAPLPARQIIAAVLAAAAAANVEVEVPDDADGSPEPGQATLWEFFHSHRFWSERNDPVQPVLILDQFEEVFTLGRHSPRSSEFLAELADLAENRMSKSVQSRFEASGTRPSFDTRAQNYKVVLSLREDFVHKLDSLRPIMPAVMRNRFALTPLDRDHAIDVVRRAGGQWVSDSVALEIVDAVAGDSPPPEPDAVALISATEIEPAYLSVMCDELFRRMIEQGKSEIDSGLVAAERGNILDGLYERSFAELDPATRSFVEDRLLTATGFRGSMPLAEARREGVSLSDLESLVNSRLLRFEDRLGTTHVELSHDLLTPIVRKSRNERWATAKAEAEREEARRREAECAAKARAEAQARVAERLKFLTAIAMVALIIAVVFAGVAFNQGSLAIQKGKIALSRYLAAEAYANSNTSPQLGLLLSAKAVTLSHHDLADSSALTEADYAKLTNYTETLLRRVLGAIGSTVLSGHGSPVFRMAFSPDGHTLASGSADRTIRLWDVKNPTAAPRVLRHGEAVSAIAFSRDGRLLASASRDGAVHLWDLTKDSPDEHNAIGHHDTFVAGIAFSPDGRTVASSSADGVVRLWDLTRSPPIPPRDGPRIPEGTGSAVAFSPDGHTLALFSRNGTMRFWDWADSVTFKSSLIETGFKGMFGGAAFSSDGHYFASASTDREREIKIKIWDLTGNPEAKPWRALPNASSEGQVLAVAFSLDGHNLVSAGTDRNVRRWNLADMSDPFESRIVVHQQEVSNVALSPDGQILASANWGDRTIRLWDLTTNPAIEPRIVDSRYGEVLLTAALGPDGHTLAFASRAANKDSSVIRLCDLRELDNPAAQPKVLGVQDGIVSALAFSPDGRTLASANADHTIGLWNPADPRSEMRVLIGHEDAVLAMAFSHDGRTLISAGEDRSIRRWDLTNPDIKPQILGKHDDKVSSLAFSPDGLTLASASADRTIRLWNPDNPAETPKPHILAGHEDAVLAMAFSPDGRTLISTGKDRSVRRWDLSQPMPESRVLRKYDDAVSTVSLSPDGNTLVSASGDSALRLWNLTAPTAEPRVFRGHDNVVTMVAFSPDGHTLVSVSDDRTIRIWHTQIDDLIDLACRHAGRDLTREEWGMYLGNETYQETCKK